MNELFDIWGGAGFIGTHLFEYIKNENLINGAAIYRYDLVINSGSDVGQLDVRHAIDIKINGISDSIIFNLAATHTTPGHADYEYFNTNIKGAQNICDFARKNNINTIVFTSSIAPYGASEDLKGESSVPMPNSPYGISKLTAEYIHTVWQSEDSLNRKLIIVRPGVVFGKSEGGNFTRLYKSLKSSTFFYPGRKDTVKACIYVKDVIRILYQTSIDKEPGVSMFYLCYYPAPTIETICKTIADVTGVKSPKYVVPFGIINIIAKLFFFFSGVFRKQIFGVHPDRVKKLIISTNISGEKLDNSIYKIRFSLNDAIKDWFIDCDEAGLL